MRETRLLMGMPITVEVVRCLSKQLLDDVFAYFAAVDRQFSPFREDSETSAINRGRMQLTSVSAEMCEVLRIAENAKRDTHGYFEIWRTDGTFDPCGVVKGWAIRNACRIIEAAGVRDYLVDAGGDIQSGGRAADGNDWRVGIRNPFNEREVVKVVRPSGGVATSGCYVRGQHIYDPYRPGQPIDGIVSMTVICAGVLRADLLATAAFAMGLDGIQFLEGLPDAEGYMIDMHGIATQTSKFRSFVVA